MRFRAFVLAAGYGERLRPITEHIPKPLLPVIGKPVLERVLERVAALCPECIGVNVHHNGDAVEEWLEGSPLTDGVAVFPEEAILGTGGALWNAGEMLGGATFLVHNADVLSDIDLDAVLETHAASQNLATLVVHDCPRFNMVALRDDGTLAGVGKSWADKPGRTLCAFTGIAVYEPAFLAFLPEGNSSVVNAWLDAVAAGHPIGTVDVTGALWRDLGTPATYASAVFETLRKGGETVYIAAGAVTPEDVGLDGYVVVEAGAALKAGTSLRNCIVLPGGVARGKERYENCVVGPGCRVNVDEAAMLGQPGASDGLLIGAGGSDRSYFRVRRGVDTAVRLQSTPEDEDFERQIEYSEFLGGCGVPVPALVKADREHRSATFEDLGDLSLYAWLKYPRDGAAIAAMYANVLAGLARIHTVAPERVAECPLLAGRVFDYDTFRWETAYFLRRFVAGYKGLDTEPEELEADLHALALAADALPKTVIHRDFQSQNVMIPADGVPRLIDYQGARMGPPSYDVASMLWDPYHRLTDEPRAALIESYLVEIRQRSAAFDQQAFRAGLVPCRLQRHMQALGAYGYLSAVKNKPYFRKYIPEGVWLLKEDIAASKGRYPALARLVEKL